ncbi:hypothetical protein SDC9_142955 [bioreactor metagenome]|uniref:Uncharacterized protein n=1 Tax=bioreactor metagenome TaxID=1076179 RepID=A0A645E213_9ZZZZ
MDARHAHVVDADDPVAHDLGGEGGLLGHRDIAGASRGDHHRPSGGSRSGKGDSDPGQGMVLQLQLAADIVCGLLGHAGDQHVAAAPLTHGPENSRDLLRRFSRPVDHFGRALTHPPVKIHLGKAKVLEGGLLELQQRLLRGTLPGGDVS